MAYATKFLSPRKRENHGLANTPEYKVWLAMKTRCYNKNGANYPYYGGRGIRVCDEWLESFKSFYDDMGKKPSSLHTLDRMDVNGIYEPSNCKWATRKEQSINQRMRKDNTSGFKGVSKPTRGLGWVANASDGCKIKFLGYFKTPEEASLAYESFVRIRDASQS